MTELSAFCLRTPLPAPPISHLQLGGRSNLPAAVAAILLSSFSLCCPWAQCSHRLRHKGNV